MPPFSGCHNLESIEIAAGNEVYASDGNCIMRKADNTLVLGCKASKIPSYTEHIGNHAFRDSGAESIALPEGVTSIGNFAFYDNDRLKEIALPQSLTSIDYYAFPGAPRLANSNPRRRDRVALRTFCLLHGA